MLILTDCESAHSGATDNIAVSPQRHQPEFRAATREDRRQEYISVNTALPPWVAANNVQIMAEPGQAKLVSWSHQGHTSCSSQAGRGYTVTRQDQGMPVPVRPEVRNRDARRAVKRAIATVSRLEAQALAFVNRGQDLTGAEITRTEFRRNLAEEAELLREQLRGIVDP